MTSDKKSWNSLDIPGSSDKVIILDPNDLDNCYRESSTDAISDNSVIMDCDDDNSPDETIETIDCSKVQNKDLTNRNNENNMISAENDINIGNIAVVNSKEVTFGNKIYYEGPVTIKQYLCDPDIVTNGAVNPVFVDENGEKIHKYSGDSPNTNKISMTQ